MKKILMGLVALSMLTVTACKKKDDEPANITPTTANMSGSYKLAKLTMTSTGSTTEVDVTNNSAFVDPCEKDDIITLSSTGTYTNTDAGVQCSPSSNDSGVWALTNSTTVTIDGIPFTINRFNGTNLDISYSDPSFGTVKQYMVKQ